MHLKAAKEYTFSYGVYFQTSLSSLSNCEKSRNIHNLRWQNVHCSQTSPFDDITVMSSSVKSKRGWPTGAVVNVADYGPRGPWFETCQGHCLHI